METVRPNFVVLMVVGARVELAQLVNNAVLEVVHAHQIVSDVSVEMMDVASTLVEDALPLKLVLMDNVSERPFLIAQQELVEATVLEGSVEPVHLDKGAEMESASVCMIAVIETAVMQFNQLGLASPCALYNHVEPVQPVSIVEPLVCVLPLKVVT